MNVRKYWLPYQLITVEGQLQCHWFNTYGEPFTEPFFEATILKCRSKENRNFLHPSVSDYGMILEWAPEFESINPSAIIFHISRCGSTLISQMLAVSDENIVLSEVPVFDDILRLRFKEPDIDETEINKLFVAALKLYGQGDNLNEPAEKKSKRVFIKTDSWHLFFYPQFRQLFPFVPFIFMYRAPDEVFSSHRKQAGMHSVQGLIEPEIFGMKPSDIAEIMPDDYLAAVLENYLSRSIEIVTDDKLSLLINYNEGPMEIIKKIAAFVNIKISESDRQKMHERSRYHSKKPDEPFNEFDVKTAPLCLTKAVALYNELERKRQLQ